MVSSAGRRPRVERRSVVCRERQQARDPARADDAQPPDRGLATQRVRRREFGDQSGGVGGGEDHFLELVN